MIGDLPQTPDWTPGALGALEAHLRRDAGFFAAAGDLRGCLVYLATPYSKLAVDERGRFSLGASLHAQMAATSWTSRFARAGVSAVSPIVMSADMVHFDQAQERRPLLDPLDAPFWERWCRPLLLAADAVAVPPIAGWAQSAGIWREVLASLSALKPVWIIREGA